jgi:hypothetical protein
VGFYEASAQILPVLALAAIVELIGRVRSIEELPLDVLLNLLSATLAFFLFVILGEISALSVLLAGRPCEWAEDATEIALVGATAMFVLNTLRPFLLGLARHG